MPMNELSRIRWGLSIAEARKYYSASLRSGQSQGPCQVWMAIELMIPSTQTHARVEPEDVAG